MFGFIVFLYLAQLAITVFIAKSKGFSFSNGLLIGAVLPFISILIMSFADRKETYGKIFIQNNNVKMVPISFTYMAENSNLSPIIIIEELRLRKNKSFTVSFTKPKNLADWEWTIRRCATMTKHLLTLHKQMPKNQKDFSIVYNSQLFGPLNEVSIRHDHLNYRFIVDTTVPFYSSGGMNPSTNLHSGVQKLMSKLLQ